MNVRYIVDFVDGGDTYGLSKILKGDYVEIYYDRSKMTGVSIPELLSFFVAKDAGAIKSLTIRPYSEDELKCKQEFLTFIVARASAKQNVTVISSSFKMAFQVTGVRVISTMDKLYKGTDPYYFSYSGTTAYKPEVASVESPQEQKTEAEVAVAVKEEKSSVVRIPQTAHPEKKVLSIKNDRKEIPDSELGEEIARCIKRHNINQRIFSELCEVNQATVSKFIRGRKDAYASAEAKLKFRKTILDLDEMDQPTAKAQ